MQAMRESLYVCPQIQKPLAGKVNGISDLSIIVAKTLL